MAFYENRFNNLLVINVSKGRSNSSDNIAQNVGTIMLK